MRRLLTLALAASLLLLIGFASPADSAEHPGCKGVDQAYSKANANGKAALTVVSEKFGCGSVSPDPVDAVACPTGQTSLARYTYTGHLSSEVDQYGYPWWIGDAGNNGWTLTSGGTDAWVEITWGSVDAGGLYWTEAVLGSVDSVVVKSYSGEVVTVVPPADRTNPTSVLSQNVFTTRTGINVVNICGVV